MEFVNQMRKEGKLIMGIGHRVKSVSGFFQEFEVWGDVRQFVELIFDFGSVMVCKFTLSVIDLGFDP